MFFEIKRYLIFSVLSFALLCGCRVTMQKDGIYSLHAMKYEGLPSALELSGDSLIFIYTNPCTGLQHRLLPAYTLQRIDKSFHYMSASNDELIFPDKFENIKSDSCILDLEFPFLKDYMEVSVTWWQPLTMKPKKGFLRHVVTSQKSLRIKFPKWWGTSIINITILYNSKSLPADNELYPPVFFKVYTSWTRGFTNMNSLPSNTPFNYAKCCFSKLDSLFEHRPYVNNSTLQIRGDSVIWSGATYLKL